jgi:hypothetical protein
MAIALGGHVDGRSCRRIFGRVVDHLHECLLHQHRIDIDQGQIGVHRHRDAVAGKPAAAPFQRGINDVLRLDPFHARFHLAAADARRIEQVLDVVVQPFRFVTHHGGE